MALKATRGPMGNADVRTFRAEGGTLTRGLAVIPGTADDQVKAAAAVATGNLKVVGIVTETAAEGEPVRICVKGECLAIVAAAVVLGDSLKTVGTASKVEPTTTDNDGVFAVARSAAATDGDECVVDVLGPARY